MAFRLHVSAVTGSVRPHTIVLLVLGCGLTLTAQAAGAQTFSVSSISASTPNLGSVVSAVAGDTVFTISASSGSVTRASGLGVRIGSTTTRALVTVACGNQGPCNNTSARIRIGNVGSPTKRARALTHFTVAAGTAVIASGPTGSNPIDFVIGPIGKNSSKTFYVGADFPIAGEDSGLATGSASSGFYVYIAPNPTVPTSGSNSGMAIATVYRPISVSKQSDLVFGAIVRPPTLSGSVTISAASGARTVSGGVVGLNVPTPTRAAFQVLGEGGRAISISVPATFVMSTSGGKTLTVTTSSTASGAQMLSGTLGSSGTLSFGVGGSIPIATATTTGAYSGVFDVTVVYN